MLGRAIRHGRQTLARTSEYEPSTLSRKRGCHHIDSHRDSNTDSIVRPQVDTPDRFHPVTLAETRYLRLVQQGHWTYAQRPHGIGGVAIIALDPEGRLLLLEQFRIPVGRQVVELPAGLLGDDTADDEPATLIESARRELIEETGYDAGSFRELTRAASSAGLTDECIHLLLASDLKRVGPGGGDAHEEITVHAIIPSEVPNWLSAREQHGHLIDFKVFAGLWWLKQLGLIE